MFAAGFVGDCKFGSRRQEACRCILHSDHVAWRVIFLVGNASSAGMCAWTVHELRNPSKVCSDPKAWSTHTCGAIVAWSNQSRAPYGCDAIPLTKWPQGQAGGTVGLCCPRGEQSPPGGQGHRRREVMAEDRGPVPSIVFVLKTSSVQNSLRPAAAAHSICAEPLPTFIDGSEHHRDSSGGGYGDRRDFIVSHYNVSGRWARQRVIQKPSGSAYTGFAGAVTFIIGL